MAEPDRSPRPLPDQAPGGRPAPPAIPARVLEGVRRGEPEALAAFFEACFDDVYGLAFRMLGQRQAAEDVTQEVFLRLHRAASTLDPARDPRPWLRTVTANLCRDHFRSFGVKLSRRSVPVEGEPGQAPALAGGGPSPEEAALASEREARVQEALASLPPDLREVVVLRDWQGLDHATIAGLVDASEAAVRKRYSRALARLGELLEGVWP